MVSRFKTPADVAEEKTAWAKGLHQGVHTDLLNKQFILLLIIKTT